MSDPEALRRMAKRCLDDEDRDVAVLLMGAANEIEKLREWKQTWEYHMENSEKVHRETQAEIERLTDIIHVQAALIETYTGRPAAVTTA